LRPLGLGAKSRHQGNCHVSTQARGPDGLREFKGGGKRKKRKATWCASETRLCHSGMAAGEEQCLFVHTNETRRKEVHKGLAAVACKEQANKTRIHKRVEGEDY